MDADLRDGRWHVVKAYPKPFVWLRRRWLALRWDGKAWERFGQWYSRGRAVEEVRMLNDTEDWIDAVHTAMDHKAPQEWGLPVTGRFEWAERGQQREAHGFDLQRWLARANLRATVAQLDRSHLGCG